MGDTNKVEIQLPAGMSREEFDKLFGTFKKQRVATQVRDKAVRSATKDLIAANKEEYDALVAKYMPVA